MQKSHCISAAKRILFLFCTSRRSNLNLTRAFFSIKITTAQLQYLSIHRMYTKNIYKKSRLNFNELLGRT